MATNTNMKLKSELREGPTGTAGFKMQGALRIRGRTHTPRFYTDLMKGIR